jgi:peptidyl-prolyl cis-trans isomerase SurA
MKPDESDSPFTYMLKPRISPRHHGLVAAPIDAARGFQRAATNVRLSFAAIALTAACSAAACGGGASSTSSASASENTWAVVEGREITRDQVDKAYRRTQQAAQPMSEEETMTAKLTLLNDLILQDILLAKATALKIEIPANELDAAFKQAKGNMSDDQFNQELTKRNVTAADMRETLRRELVTNKVIEHEVQAKITVSDQEVKTFFDANREQFNFPEPAYRIAQIVITPVREPQQSNRLGDDAQSPEQAATKAQSLMARLKQGANFGETALDYSEDAASAARGGDLGFVPLSKLNSAPPRLRDAVLKVPVGTVSLASEGGNHTIVAVVAYEAAGQRDLSVPDVKESITNTLKARKEQLLRAAYLTAARSDANVTNYLARRLVEAQGKAPGVGLAAPGKQ